MRKIETVLFVLFVVLCLLMGCEYEGSYNDGYERGFSDGYSEARSIYEDEYSRGYEDGYSEGYSDDAHECELANSIDQAYDYAREKTGWSVYEAWNNIGIYHDGYDPLGYPLPTYEEYRQSIETLVYFCEYLDGVDLYH